MIAITVGVACYNVEAWVEECVASLLGQTFKDFEIVAINDGSTDQTGTLLDSLAARDDRLRVIHQENAGRGRVRNRILREARGRYFTFVDADDWIDSECLAKTYHRAVKDDLDVVAFGWIRIEEGTGRVLGRRNDHQGRNVTDVAGMRKTAFSGSINLMTCASLIRRRLFVENSLVYPSVLHEDIYITPFLYFYGKRFGYVHQDLYYWRVRTESITQTLTKSRIDGLTGVFEFWKENLLKDQQFKNYKSAAIAGCFFYLFSSRIRIFDQGNDDAEMLVYLRNRIRNLLLSAPELREYKEHLSTLELKKYADIISIIEQTPSERNEGPRMIPTPEIPSVGRRLIHICRNRNVRSFAGRRLTSPTAALLAAGLALTGAAHAGPVWSAWLPVPGLALVCFVVIKEAVLWRWRREEDLARFAAQWKWMRSRFSTDRFRSEKALSEAVSSERARSERVLSETLSTERTRWERSLSEALSSERARSERMLTEAVLTERTRWERSLSEALSSERTRSERALSVERTRSERALSVERTRSERALSVERTRSERALSVERSRRTLVDVHLADRGLPMSRILLLFTMHRAGSTWLFDLLRTHSAVRVESTARVWTALGFDGWRYPGAFHHVDGASVPLEITPGLGAVIPAFPRVDIPGIDEADQWVLEKGHPEFVGFEANRLAAMVRNLRGRGVEIEIMYGVRCPLDSMWSMAEAKTREPSWYRKVPFKEVPRHTAQSLVTLAETRSLIGGTVVEYESLPDGPALRGLCRRLAPDWGETEIDRWLAHAAAATERAKRRQREDAGFLGDREPFRDPGGPEGIWLSCTAEMEAAKTVYRCLISEDEAG